MAIIGGRTLPPIKKSKVCETMTKYAVRNDFNFVKKFGSFFYIKITLYLLIIYILFIYIFI